MALLVLCSAVLGAAAISAPSGADLEGAARLAFDGKSEDAIALLRPLAADTAAAAELHARTSFLLGTLLLKVGRPTEATAPLEAAAAHPLLGDHALARLGAAQRAAGDPGAAAKALGRLLASYPQSPLADAAWRDLGRAAADAGDLPTAEGALQQALGRARGGGAQAGLQLLLAEVLARAGRPGEAIPLLRELWLMLPATREADRAADVLAGLPGASPFTDDERFQRAMRLYRGTAYAKAARELAPFAERTGANAAQARLALGVARFHAREYAEAIRVLDPLAADAAGSGRAEALFWLARSYGRLGDRTRFSTLLEELVAVAPRHDRADDALYLLAGGYIDEGRRDRAADALDRLIRDYPKGDRIDAARWMRAWLWFREGQHARAAAAFHNLAARGPRWWAQATYWEARAEEAAGRGAEARRLYGEVVAGNEAYYGWLARVRLGQERQLAATSPLPAPAPPGHRGRLPVARALAALWLADEATEEYAGLVREHPEDRGLVAEATAVALRLQRVDRAVAIAKRVLWPQYVQSGGVPPIPGFWPTLYPQGYWNLVADRAAARRLDPFLVLALIREESAFSPQALSPVGARGLMQVMPATAMRLAGAFRLPPPGNAAALEEPAYNLMAGTAELADLLDQFNGDVVLALAAYNAGPHNVRRWLQERGYAGPEEFAEEIPFDETRAYVKRVLGSYDRYRQLYASSQAPNLKSGAEALGGGMSGSGRRR